MLKRLIAIAALTLPILFLAGSGVRASDIGGPPVKAIPFETTYSTVYSATYFGSPFWYSQPQTILITPVVPYNSITVTTGHTRLELINPDPYAPYSYSAPGQVYGLPGQAILTQPGTIYQRPNHPHRANNQGLNCRSRRDASFRSGPMVMGGCG